jgi:serine O-acetyltransferase
MTIQVDQSEDRIATRSYSNLNYIATHLRNLRTTSQKSRYNAGPIPELPSREAMTGIVETLVGALYLCP